MKFSGPVILAILCLSTLLSNCDCKHVCTSPIPVLKFRNLDSASLSAVIVKWYNNNGQFNDLEQTYVYTSIIPSTTHMLGQDTIQMDSSGVSLPYSTDCTIEIPAIGRTWYLRNLSMQATKMSASNCTNGIKYYLNDTLYTIFPNAMAANIQAEITITR